MSMMLSFRLTASFEGVPSESTCTGTEKMDLGDKNADKPN